MATVPTFTDNAVAHGSDLGFILDPPRCHAYCTASTSVPTGTDTLIPFAAEAYDTDGMHSTSSNTSRVIAQTTGLFLVTASIAFSVNLTGGRSLAIRKNAAGNSSGGVGIGGNTAQATAYFGQVMSTFYVQMTAGDYLEMFAQQVSGSTLTIVGGTFATFMQMQWAARS